MQKKIIALAVAALASTAAFAQTNVTVYGIADASLSATTTLGAATAPTATSNYATLGPTQTGFKVNSGTLSTSRIGFKGVEDLGNGLKALFVLEYGLAIDASAPVGTSSTSSAVARQQFVGLTGGFGTAVAGHLQTTGLDFTVGGSALGGSTALGVTNVLETTGNTGLMTSAATHLISAQWGGRHSNAVAYISPSFGGVTVAYNHARVTETAGTTGNTDAHGDLLSVNFANGPITAGAIYTRVTLAGANNNIKEWGLRGGYDFGVAKLQATYQQAKSEALTTGKDSKYVVSVTVPVGAKVAVIGEFGGAIVKSDTVAGVNPENNVRAGTVAATYALSKRTTAYAGMVAKRSQVVNSDTNTYAIGLRHSF
jgi:predicted porin